MDLTKHPYWDDWDDTDFVGGRKLCPLCEQPIEERQQTCRQCAAPGEQCRCGAELPMGPYGHRYACCENCAGDREPDYDAPTAQETFERAWREKYYGGR